MTFLKKLNREIKLRIFYFVILVVVGFWIAPTWPVFLLVWLGISVFWIVSDKIKLLSPVENKLYTVSLYFYPLLGTIIKFVILAVKSDSVYFWVNRIEHGIWALALTILLLPAWKMISSEKKLKLGYLGLFIVIVGVICLFGNLVEFVEFGQRVMWRLDHKYALYYPDTIFDMMSNVVGASVGFVLVWWSGKSVNQLK